MTSIIPRRVWERLTARAPAADPAPPITVHVHVQNAGTPEDIARVVSEAIRRSQGPGWSR